MKLRLATASEIASLSGEVSDENIKDHLVLCSILVAESATKKSYIAVGFNDFDPYIALDVRVVSKNLIETAIAVYSVEMKQATPHSTITSHLKQFFKNKDVKNVQYCF